MRYIKGESAIYPCIGSTTLYFIQMPMKKTLFLFIILVFLTVSSVVSAQGMMGFFNSSSDSTAIQSQQQEEQEGKNFLDNLKNKTATCSQLKDTDFEKIGEYFMGQSIGNTSRHIAMNEMMKSMMGEQGEEQMHTAWGKRGSGCDTSASYPQGFSFMPMMGGWSSSTGTGFNQNNNNSMMWGFGNNPMGWGFGFGWIFMILFWGLIIWGIIALVRGGIGHGCWGRGHNGHGERTPLDILKERYAKGEINREEFETKKKDLE